jgi:hypothetical protein
MKKLLFVIVIVGVGYFVYQRELDKTNPQVIDHPVYAEFRVDSKQGEREINIALFGKMSSEEDCRMRAEKVWNKVVKGCAACTMSVQECRSELPPRYKRLFEDVSIPSTYLSFMRGNRFERDGRMVVYGLTSQEGVQVCEYMKTQFAATYEGTVTCVPASE